MVRVQLPQRSFTFSLLATLQRDGVNSQRHLLPPHPDAQLTWARHALIYGGWVWLTVFFQNSYIGCRIKNSQQQQPKLGWKKSSMWTLMGERFYHCWLRCPKWLCIYKSRKSPTGTCYISIVRTCWHCCGDRHRYKTGDFLCAKPDFQCLSQTQSCCSKLVPLFKNNIWQKLSKIKKCQY